MLSKEGQVEFYAADRQGTPKKFTWKHFWHFPIRAGTHSEPVAHRREAQINERA